MKRRTFLGGTGAVLGLALAGCNNDKGSDTSGGGTPTDPTPSTTGTGTTTTSTTTVATGPFTTPMVIPPELVGSIVDGRRVFELTLQEGTTEFFPGMPADTKGYNGDLLGPTLRARQGEALTILVTNDLNEDATTHWHGAHLPASADGGPHQVIPPGRTWTSEWDVDQLASTMWYHPHLMGTTAEHVYAGLAGLFILDDDERDTLDLPVRYGVDDIPIVIQDRRFTPDGQLDYTLGMMDQQMGFQGDTVLTNGVIKPFIDVEAKQIRFRILNGSNARIYEFGFSDNTEFQLIGTDNSLLDAPALLTRLWMSPGERYEIVVDLTDRIGESLRFADNQGMGDIFEINVTEAATVTTTVPAVLTTLDRLDPDDVVRTRPFLLTMGMGMNGSFRINGESFDINVINERVPIGDVEIWEIRNLTMMTHNFHKHSRHFEILSRNGNPPEAHETGFKDTVLMPPGDVVQVITKHDDFVDNTVPYMYHCHILEHEDQGMMGQFTVE